MPPVTSRISRSARSVWKPRQNSLDDLKDLFLLDPQVVFLNHGSFGACPKPVFEVYQAWQRRLEKQPVLFLGREFNDLMGASRQALGECIHADADDLIYLPNATHAVNIVARSLNLSPGDEILTSDHEYGACDNTWDFICRKSGARYIHQPIPLPVSSPTEFVETLWQGVTQRTKLIYLSHITSPTAQLFPVETLCRRARQAGILSLIDGAHAPGQVELDLKSLDADFYFGNCHKWMLSPKGAAFLYTRKELQGLIEPLVVSWGWSADKNTTTGSRYVDILQWTGTHDPSAVLSVPAALQFLHDHDWNEVRRQCHALLVQALARAEQVTGLPGRYRMDGPHASFLPLQMGILPLPVETDLTQLKMNLYEKYRIEIPCVEWNGAKFLRVSIQGYNDETDVNALIDALKNEIIR
jgi:isopenicillin-N epimerase